MEGNFSRNFITRESRIGSSLREFRIIGGSRIFFSFLLFFVVFFGGGLKVQC